MSNPFLDQPRTEKELERGDTFGFAAMQGWRSTAEDFHKHLIPFDQHSWQLWSYFSIFDGHAGTDTAKYGSRSLDHHLLNALNCVLTEDNEGKNSDKPVHSSDLNLDHFRRAIKQTYFDLDQDLKRIVKDHSGCVCITCLVGPEKIYLINIGDSRAIVFSEMGKVLAQTQDHKPDFPREQRRVEKAGGIITKATKNDVSRVDGQLAMTRVLGDFGINKEVVPPMADIFEYPRKSAAFLVLACDGIWDVMENEEVASFVCQRAVTSPLDQIASELLDECLRRQSSDNMSVYIVKL